MTRRFDAIVAGSGISGLTAAAALAKRGRRVLVLERHTQLGGLTQTFVRGPYRFAVGVHYIGGVGDAPGEAGEFGRLLDWLTNGRLRFASARAPRRAAERRVARLNAHAYAGSRAAAEPRLWRRLSAPPKQ